ncbi:MAG TPA: glycosyltransferase [Terriglobales bacterium]|nr:glycosyltransferase [Terriglobales bacterium]
MLSMPLLVFSHLRWDSVRQRPHHLLSRFAKDRRVVFVEEPVHDRHRGGHWEIERPEANLMVCRPHTPLPVPGFAAEQTTHLTPMLRDLRNEHLPDHYVAWLYTPLALPFVRPLRPDLLVYDCMDELSAFKFAPQSLVQWEDELLQEADLVFTGGPSLYAARQHRHPHVHCFPSSVDSAHFAQARQPQQDPPDQAELRRPRLGFFGVLDERIDIELIGALSAARPDWEIVLIGPVVKIDSSALPQAPNLHHLGARNYESLPGYLAGWDVCLLPFALNESTRFISPTKTLEYMAADKPIVSTPVADVRSLYGEVVDICDTPEAFVAACERALSPEQGERDRRRAAANRILARTSWDNTVRSMLTLMAYSLQRKRRSSDSPSDQRSELSVAL